MKYVGGKAFAFILMGMALLSGCALKGNQSLPIPSDKIAAVTGEFPAVVLVVLPEGRGICTGAFVSEKAVLTAAHCTKESGMYRVMSSFGTFSTYEKQRLGPGVVNDPNDIALLIFDEPKADRSKGQVYDLGDGVRSGDQARLVGFGCNNLTTRSGSGTKRTGTNVVARVSDYIEFETPLSSIRGILGPDNRAASCFGDSGGPALKQVGSRLEIVGVTHAGGADGDVQISEYADVANRSDNRDFLRRVSDAYGLDIRGI